MTEFSFTIPENYDLEGRFQVVVFYNENEYYYNGIDGMTAWLLCKMCDDMKVKYKFSELEKSG